MSFCENCGTQVDGNSQFCGKCGKEIKKGGSKIHPAELGITVINNINNKLSTFKIPKKVIGVAAVAIIILLVMTGIFRNEQKKVDLNKYFSVEFEGYDTLGIARADFDQDNFALSVLKAQGKKVPNVTSEDFSLNDLSLDSITSSVLAYQLQDSIETEITPSEGLKNGDTVTLTIKFDKDVAKDNGVKFIAKEQTYTVKGLEELKEVDPFEGLEVSFSGIAPDASVDWDNTSDDDFISSLYYSVDKSNGLNIGDTVTFTINMDEEDALQRGYKLTQLSKEYVCENTDQYISTCASITEDTLAKIQQESLDTLEAAYARISSNVVNSGLTYEGIYLLSAKETSGWLTNNYIYVIYSTTVTSLNESFEPTVLYIPVRFYELVQKADGTQEVNLSGPQLYGSSGLTYSWFSELAGYTDTAKMYSDIITSNKDEYTYDISDGLKQFSN